MKNYVNTLLLVACLAVVVGVGQYLTGVRQPAKVTKIENTIKLAGMQQVQVSELLVQQAASEDLATQSLAKWKARYKEIPATLNTADMILYLEDLTATGFEQFDVNLVGNTTTENFSYYSFDVNATAYFTSMYHFVWHIENNREFYRIRDLRVNYSAVYTDNSATAKPRRMDMVEFGFRLDAFYAGNEAMSAPGDTLLPVPRNLLPTHDPAHNSFFPIVRTDLPPNDEMLLDVDAADLISIVGRRAIFDSGGFQYVVEEGDRIYLGNIMKIDPNGAKVRVQLNKGGNIMAYDIELNVDRMQNARQSGVQFQPVDN